LAVVVYIDGLAQPSNPGIGTYGYVIYQGGKKLAEGGGLAGRSVTNNYAEYTAVVEALQKLRSMGILGGITVRSDSKLLVGQLSQGWKARGGGYIEKFKEAKDLLAALKSVKFEWIPREKNQEADLLTRIAYERATSGARG
jgi:ribonuclease HI